MSSREYFANIKNQSLVEPRESEKFYPSKVTAVIKETLEFLLRDYEMDVATLNLKTEEVTKSVREAVKMNTNMPRYKIVSQVVMGPIDRQGVKVVSKCLWDVNSDNYASYTFKNESFYCTAMVFGCFNE